jgi:prepilin-type processing-associated H-X9-DG protein/prepilin-type N-terminal cleavage/methylation domain-containing protein
MQGDSNQFIALFQIKTNRRPAAFTLVELLVVIGIIALLISILLPALSKAREEAKRTACEAKLRQICMAAQLHTMDHHGYYPLAGVLPGCTPTDLDDAYSTKYDYVPNGFASQGPPVILSPITFALSLEFGRSNKNLSNAGTDAVQAYDETDPNGFIKNFLCPSQASSVSELLQLPMLYVTDGAGNDTDDDNYDFSYTEAQSYIFNEVICGWEDELVKGRLQGRASAVRQPAATMFVCDGLQGVPTGQYPTSSRLASGGESASSGMATLYNFQPTTVAPVTMADAYAGAIAGDPNNFDKKRHLGKINIGFCDGHVETRNINSHGNVVSSDLVKVFLLAP